MTERGKIGVMPTGHHYCAFGLHIASDIALPELDSLQADATGLVDVAFRIGSVPDGRAPENARALHVDGDEAVLAIDRIARYRISAGSQIMIEPLGDASERNVRLFLLGSAFGVLCHQRGLLPLHANAIVHDGQAVAFAGRSGIGKSTLAAHFQSRGYDVLCDDVCVVSLDADGRPLAWPGLPRLKLWEDAAQRFGHDSSNLERAIDGLDKYHVPFDGPAAETPYGLSRLYVLSDAAKTGEGAISQLHGFDALQAVMANVYRSNYLKPMGLAKPNFERAIQTTKRIEVYTAPLRRGFDIFAEEVEKLERHFQQQ